MGFYFYCLRFIENEFIILFSINSRIMNREENLYIKLFISLRSNEEKDIYELWMENIEEKIYQRKKAIERYCKEKDCDFMIALFSIFEKIKDKYLIKFKSFNNGEISYKFMYLSKKSFREQPEKSFVSKFGNLSQENNDIDNILSNIKIIIDQRRNNPDKYFQDILNTPCYKNMKDYFEIQKSFYYPYFKFQKIGDKAQKNKLLYSDKYEDMVEDLRPFIKNITPKILKHIIEKLSLPLDSQPLIMLKNNKSNIVRFADCFEIPIRNINMIFSCATPIKDCNRNEYSKNDFLKVLHKYNNKLYRQ